MALHNKIDWVFILECYNSEYKRYKKLVGPFAKPEHMLIYLYRTLNSSHKMSKILGVSPCVILKQLRFYGCSTQPPFGLIRNRKLITNDFLKLVDNNEGSLKKLTVQQIKNHLKCSRYMVYHLCKKFSIKYKQIGKGKYERKRNNN